MPNDALPTSQGLSAQHPGSADVPLSEHLSLPRPRASSDLYRRRPHVQKQVLSTGRRVRCRQASARGTPRVLPLRSRSAVLRRRWSWWRAVAATSQTEAAGNSKVSWRPQTAGAGLLRVSSSCIGIEVELDDVDPATIQSHVNPLTPTVAVWVQL